MKKEEADDFFGEAPEDLACYKAGNRYIKVQGLTVLTVTVSKTSGMIMRHNRSRSMPPYIPYVEEGEKLEIITPCEFRRVHQQELTAQQDTYDMVGKVNGAIAAQDEERPVHSFKNPIAYYGYEGSY